MSRVEIIMEFLKSLTVTIFSRVFQQVSDVNDAGTFWYCNLGGKHYQNCDCSARHRTPPLLKYLYTHPHAIVWIGAYLMSFNNILREIYATTSPTIIAIIPTIRSIMCKIVWKSKRLPLAHDVKSSHPSAEQNIFFVIDFTLQSTVLTEAHLKSTWSSGTYVEWKFDMWEFL